jgi:ABC-type dipeptide/oligopeptide/nickel transport system ATPase component
MLLSVQDLSVRFKTEDGTVHAVNGVSFDLDASETLGIVGESGCGKSATSLAITRLLPRTHATIAGGRILFRDVDLIQLPDREMRKLRGRDIAIVFQDPMTSLNPVLTIGRQLTEALCAHQYLSRQDADARAIDLLQTVGIAAPAAALDRYPHQMSGGMRQRVMIAMALALAPKLLIAERSSPDEVFAPYRGAPHSGLARLISRIRSRVSLAMPGLPRRRRDFHHHRALKPRRCQRTIVSGWRRTIESNMPGQSR